MDAFFPFFQKPLTSTPPDNSKRAANVTPDYDLKAIGPRGGPLSVTFPNYGQPWSSWVQNALIEIGIKPIAGLVSGTARHIPSTLSMRKHRQRVI